MSIRKRTAKQWRVKKCNHGARPIAGRKFSKVRGLGKK